jgi:PAS domain S-box-containing protein
VSDYQDEIRRLEKRIDKLSKEKARLKLLDEIFRSFENRSSFSDVVNTILENALLLLGGMELSLVYKLGGKWHQACLYGDSCEIDPAVQPQLIEVLKTRKYLEIRNSGDDATIRSSGFAEKARYKVDAYFPLIEGGEVIAILSVLGKFINDEEITGHFNSFFKYSGIMLKNALTNELSYSSMQDEFAQIFNSNIDGILVLEEDLSIRTANLKMHQLAGLPADRLEGRDIKDLKELEFAVRLILEHKNQFEESIEETVSLISKIDGTTQHCILSVNPLRNFEREITGYILNFKDINSLKKTENHLRKSKERFSLAMQGTNEGLWDWDIETDEVYFSPRWKEIVGYQDDEIDNLIGEWERLTEKTDWKRVCMKTDAALNGKSDRYEAEFRMLHKDGHLVSILSKGKIIRAPSGKAVRMIGTHNDITERRTREEELNVAKLKAEESERLKTAFLANMSHEIRTPLNGIMGFSRLLAEPVVEDDKRLEYAGIVMDSGKRLLNVVNDILDLAQLDSGNMVIHKTSIELNTFLDSLYLFYKDQADIKSLAFRIDREAGEDDLFVSFDHNRMFQIFSNLISNAFKFTKKGEVVFGYNRSEAGSLRYFVRDTGIGIPKSAEKNIFDRFYQEQAGYTRSFGGNGLGLSICRKLIELHGGKLELISEVGKGSEFFFSLE